MGHGNVKVAADSGWKGRREAVHAARRRRRGRTAVQRHIAVVAPIQCPPPRGRPAEGRHGRQNHFRVVRIARGERAPVVETR